jgi:large subunit ribosomal protein L18
MHSTKLREKRHHRQVRVRHQVSGLSDRPRLHVFRSNRYIYAQIIDDAQRKTLVAASQQEAGTKGTKTQQATAVGELIAQKAKKAKIIKVRFDRGYYNYHGRVKAVAEGARKQGLEF